MGNVSQSHFENGIDLSTVEFTKIPDIDLYRRDALVDGQVASAAAGRSWLSQIEALSNAFPDVQKDTIALALISLYFCRICEDQEATFRLANAVVPGASGIESVVQMGIEGRETFPDFLARVAVQETHSLVNSGSRQFFNREQRAHLVVSKGTVSADAINADVHMHINEAGGFVVTTAAHVERAFSQILRDRLTAMARSVAADRFRPIVFHAIMPAAEREQVVGEWNDTAVDYRYDGGLVAMFEKAAKANPDHPAVIFKNEEISFGEFNARVNRLARMLKNNGVSKDDFVCLCMERSIELVVALWAVLKAGGAYVPLNTEDPRARIAEIIEDCAPKFVLTQAHLTDHLPDDAPVCVVEEGGTGFDEWSEDDLGFHPDADALAYMIYTSGSTGKPKGVTVEHEPIFNRVLWMHDEYGLEADDRVLQKTPYTFDVSVWEFLWSFAVGSTLVVAEPGGHVAMRYLYQLMDEQRVTHLHFVPSVMRLFLMLPELDKLPIKKLFCSGEALGFDSVQTFYEKANTVAEVHNLYGPTEAAVDVSYFHCPRNPADQSIPIGKPVANTGLYVLDVNGQPLPIGVPGELHIGGVQLARGYWARPDLTEDRFVVTLVDDIRHKRLYKTGDLAYFRRDSEIMYLGRNDFQVKINGVRMELGEIEAVIRMDERTKDVVVVAEDIGGNKSLVAYVVSSEPGEATAEEIKADIAASRPPYYVPREVRFLKEMPLTVSGKINRKLLADMPRI